MILSRFCIENSLISYAILSYSRQVFFSAERFVASITIRFIWGYEGTSVERNTFEIFENCTNTFFPKTGIFSKFSRCIYQQHPINNFLLHFYLQIFQKFRKKCSKIFRGAFVEGEGGFHLHFCFLNFSKMLARIKSKFGMHIELTKCHSTNIETKILTQN